ncbi:MAG: helix-turn-helix domain-containing protein [Actinomycetota bacterium]
MEPTSGPAHQVVIITFDGVQSIDVAGPAEVFCGADQTVADLHPGGQGYDVSIVSVDGGVVRTESAVRFDTDPIADLGDDAIDTLVVPGGFVVGALAEDPIFVAGLRALGERCRRLVTVCSGAHLTAATGLLDGHTVTTHWARAERMTATYRDVTVDADPIFIHSPSPERDVWSSAGVTAGIDLALALVERDHSTEVAQFVARWLVMYLRRPGGQSQFATPTWIRQAPPGPIRQAQDLIVQQPAADHRIVSLAEAVAMSERHFVRRFTAEVGISPAKFVSQVRVNAARHELEQSDDSVASIAGRCGFGTAETLRRSLQRHLGVSPEGYRRRFSHQSDIQSDNPSNHQPKVST